MFHFLVRLLLLLLLLVSCHGFNDPWALTNRFTFLSVSLFSSLWHLSLWSSGRPFTGGTRYFHSIASIRHPGAINPWYATGWLLISHLHFVYLSLSVCRCWWPRYCPSSSLSQLAFNCGTYQARDRVMNVLFPLIILVGHLILLLFYWRSTISNLLISGRRRRRTDRYPVMGCDMGDRWMTVCWSNLIQQLIMMDFLTIHPCPVNDSLLQWRHCFPLELVCYHSC